MNNYKNIIFLQLFIRMVVIGVESMMGLCVMFLQSQLVILTSGKK